MDNFRKQINRQLQKGTQMFDKTKKSDVLSDLSVLEHRITIMVRTVDEITTKLYECLRTRHLTPKDGEKPNKKMYKLKEYHLQQSIKEKTSEIEEQCPDIELLTGVLREYENCVDVLWEEQQRAENDILNRIVAPVRRYAEELRAIMEKRDKLKRAVLDMDVARNKLQHACKAQEIDKIDTLQYEFDSTTSKVDQMKEDLLADMYSLAAKEVEIANLYSVLIQTQLDYHRTVAESLQQALPNVQKMIGAYEHRPIFGTALSDHLRYSRRNIALPIEVCCAALMEIGLEEDGIFRQSGNASRVRKLRAAFDAGEVVRASEALYTANGAAYVLQADGERKTRVTPLDDAQRDPHAVASCLKQYLRELPDTLTTMEHYKTWAHIAECDSESDRTQMIMELIPKLPAENQANLRYLMRFLHHLCKFEGATRMNARNLSLVIGPNILVDTKNESSSMHCAPVVETMIRCADIIFADGEPTPFTSAYIRPLLDRTGGFGNTTFAPPPKRELLVSANPTGAVERPTSVVMSAQKAATRPKARAPPPPQHGGVGGSMLDATVHSSNDSLYDNNESASVNANRENIMSKSMHDASSTPKSTTPRLGFEAVEQSMMGHRKTPSYDTPSTTMTATKVTPARPPPPQINRRPVAASHENVSSIDINDDAHTTSSQQLSASMAARPKSYAAAMFHAITDPVADSHDGDNGVDSADVAVTTSTPGLPVPAPRKAPPKETLIASPSPSTDISPTPPPSSVVAAADSTSRASSEDKPPLPAKPKMTTSITKL